MSVSILAMHALCLRFNSSAVVYLIFGECILFLLLLMQSCSCVGSSLRHSSKMKVSKYRIVVIK